MSSKNTLRNARISSLDWLRGLMAISIMLFHFTSWQFGEVSPDSVLGRMGIYGVSMFYILSGLSIAINYTERVENEWIKFFISRVFRIIPLLSLTVIAKVLADFFIDNETTSVYKIIINITGLFGILEPDAYIPIGAWSVGNEIVFYLITPMVILTYRRSKAWANLLYILSILVGVYFGYVFLNSNLSLTEQWRVYINPLNQVFLYISGFFIYWRLNTYKTGFKKAGIIIIGLVLLLMSYGSFKSDIELVTGSSRFVLSVICILVVAAVYTMQCGKEIKLLNKLGDWTYSIYLLHPFALKGTQIILLHLGINSALIVFLVAIITTILLSGIVYYYYEKRFIALGKKIINKVKKTENSGFL